MKTSENWPQINADGRRLGKISGILSAFICVHLRLILFNRPIWDRLLYFKDS